MSKNSKYRNLWTVFPVLIFWGCSTTIRVSSEESFSLEENAKVVAYDQSIREVKRVVVQNNSLKVSDSYSDQDISLPLSGVQEVVVTQRILGALQGLGLGLLSGAVISFAVFNPSMLWAGFYFGPIIGAIKGRKRFYTFEPRNYHKSAPVAPEHIEPEEIAEPPVSQKVTGIEYGTSNTLSRHERQLIVSEKNQDASGFQVDSPNREESGNSGAPDESVPSKTGVAGDEVVVDP